MRSEPSTMRPAHGPGWLGASGQERGLPCKHGGPHRLAMHGDGADVECVVCKRPRPATERGGPPALTELRHPMREPIRAAQGAGAYGVVDVAARRAGER